MGIVINAAPIALLRLLQLASPALPVGAYSYSEGLEFLAQVGKLPDAASLEHWITQELCCGAIRLEAAVMVRSYAAIAHQDFETVLVWNRWLSAARETEELRSQSWQMGRSLLRLIQQLEPNLLDTTQATTLQTEGCNFAIAFALIAVHWQIDCEAALLGYLHSWATNLTSVGMKVIPIGQTAGQTLLLDLQPTLAQVTKEILALPDEDLASCGWGLALASMAHETQYSRLFRS
jgi:urease accessory protein